MARVCRWHGGKKAALSLRFDDSDVTHIERAAPMLNEHGLVGTFMVNPGNSSYQKYKAEWEGSVIQQGHELGDHTQYHSGASTDAEAEAAIGEPAKLLHSLQPEKKLITFLGGGGTWWTQRKPFAFFMAKYDLYRGGYRSMSCSEEYEWFTYEAFTRRVEEGIAEGDSLEFHFHPVGEGHLYISPALFRRLLEYVRAQKGSLWQAGMSAIHQYGRERDNARAWAHEAGDDAVALHLTCATEPELYQQELTLEVDLPAGAGSATVTDGAGQEVASRIEEADGRRVVRFEAAPVDAAFTVRAEGIGAAGREESRLEAPGPHPYLFFTREDIPGLVERTKEGATALMWERIKGRADDLAGGEEGEWAGCGCWVLRTT